MSESTLKLTTELENFLAVQVREGTYPNRAAAIAAAVEHEKRRTEQHAWLRREVQTGLDSGSAGALKIDNVIRRGRTRLAARKAGTRS